MSALALPQHLLGDHRSSPIGEVREELGLGVHEIAGVLSTLPRRWRNRYQQTGPLPYEVEGKGSQRRYRMRAEVAELIGSLV